MFSKNLEAIRQKNPSLCEKLINIELKPIEAFQSQSGDLNICYQNTELHSTTNPVEEAQALFNQVCTNDSKNSIYIVFGLGLGYLLKRIHMSSAGKIILYEPFTEILRFTLEYVDFSQELADPRVYICSTPEEAFNILGEKYISGDKIEICYLPSYLKIASQEFEPFTSGIVSTIQSRNQDQNTIMEKASFWGRFALKNMFSITQSLPISEFKGIFSDTPIVLALAGPSLEENIQHLKNHRGKFILVTVNTAMRSLLNNDIIPDFCFISEHVNIDYQLSDLKNLDKVTYILHPRADRYSWTLNPERNCLYLTETDGFSIWYNKLLNNKYTLNKSAGTVAILAFYAIFEIFQSQNITLVGQDLALIDNKLYGNQTYTSDFKVQIQDNKLIANFNNGHQFEATLTTIKNKDGKEILTRTDYYQYIKQYEEIIKNDVPSSVTIYNTSLKGAYIEGMHYKAFTDIFNDLSQQKSSSLNIFNEKYNTLKAENNSDETLLNKEITQFYNEIETIYSKCMKLKVIIRKFNQQYMKNKHHSSITKFIQDFYKTKEAVSTFLSNNSLVFFMLQKELISYSNDYNLPEAGKSFTIEQYYENFKAEHALLIHLIEHLDIIKVHLEKFYFNKLKAL